MIRYIKFFFATAAVLVIANACNKVGNLPYYAAGNAITLSGSSNSVAPTQADSNNAVITFSWSDPAYASSDSSRVKYVVELDSAGRNFSQAVQYTITGSRSLSFTGTQINNLLIGWGFPLNAATNVDVRAISSLANNNEQLFSNVLSLPMTPYALPFNLTATDRSVLEITIINKQNTIETFHWGMPAYQNATYTYELQYDSAGKSFANPKVAATGITDTTAGVLAADMNTYASNAGVAYGIQGALEFRIAATINGKQQVYSSAQTVQVIPNNIAVSLLYVPGDYQGWSPSTAPPLASTDGVAYDGYVNITSTNGFKLTSNPDWSHTNYGDGGNGTLSTDGGAGNLNVPAAGYYRLQANTGGLTWSATATNWGMIGAATPGGWDNSTPLVFDAATNTWTLASLALTAGDFKFRANNSWDVNLGGDPSKMNYGGSNLSVAENGNYKVVLDLSNPAAYKYTLTKL